MHISEGVLSGPVLFTGAALTLGGLGIGLKKLDYDQIAKAGLLSAAFFVASLIHIPIGPSNAHLILNGLVGVLLGWGAFPAILVALALQAVFFQYGGITTLGVNTLIMALPAVICYLVFGRLVQKSSKMAAVAAFACGFLSVFLSSLFVSLSLLLTEENFLAVCGIIIAAHIPVMVIEGMITSLCVAFLRKVHPEMLPGGGGITIVG